MDHLCLLTSSQPRNDSEVIWSVYKWHFLNSHPHQLHMNFFVPSDLFLESHRFGSTSDVLLNNSLSSLNQHQTMRWILTMKARGGPSSSLLLAQTSIVLKLFWCWSQWSVPSSPYPWCYWWYWYRCWLTRVDVESLRRTPPMVPSLCPASLYCSHSRSRDYFPPLSPEYWGSAL